VSGAERSVQKVSEVYNFGERRAVDCQRQVTNNARSLPRLSTTPAGVFENAMTSWSAWPVALGSLLTAWLDYAGGRHGPIDIPKATTEHAPVAIAQGG
jgi:hypothetical protein